MISFIFWFEIIYFVLPDANIFLWIAESVADTAAVNRNGIKTLLANGLSTFSIKDNPDFSNDLKGLPRLPYLSYFPILKQDNPTWSSYFMQLVFDNFILADEPFAKALQSLETCVLVNSKLWGKLFSS